nr:phosphate/phosphite/phosphonate ABC transporter substrate-binding protein [Halococcus saccharolyticus]
MGRSASGLSRRAALGTIATAGVGTLGGCLGSVASSEQLEMTVGIVPDVDPDTAIEKNQALKSYLEGELDASVTLRTTADYAGLVQAMSAEQVDFAYFGGVSYVLAHHRAGAEAVVVGSKNGSTKWHSAFITHESTGLSKMNDVATSADELDLVFGDPISTSGTVMPTHYLRNEYDLAPKRDFANLTHVGAHDATAKAIANASGDVGALNARIYDALVEEGSIGESVVELWRTPGFADYPWAAAKTLDADTRDAIRTAFTGLDESGKSTILDQQNVDEYVETSHEQFETLDSAVRTMGLLDSENAAATSANES